MGRAAVRRIAGGRLAQAGLTLLELVLGLSVLAVATVGMNQLSDRWSDDTRNTVTASQVRTFGEAARSYIKDNYAAVQAVATPTAPAIIDVATLVAAGKLPAGYLNTNAFGHATCALVLEPVADRLQAMVITEGGTAVGDPSLAQIASVIGGSGGGVYATAPASIQGAVGGWNLAASTFDNRANNLGRRCDGAAGNVRVATGHPVMALWFENGDTSAAFLVRDAVPGRPELNAMNTPLVMKSVQTANAACTDTGAIAQDGNGRILSCQSGLWRASGDGSCQPTSSDLNLLEEGARCYNGIALPNSPGGGDWVFIEVTRHYNSGNYYATQRVTGMTGPSTGKTWVRTQNSLVPGGGWTAWNQVTDPAVLLHDGSIDAANTVTGLSVNALGNLAAGQGVFAAGNLTSTNGSVVTNQDAVNHNGSTYNLGESWAFAGFTGQGVDNRELGAARGSALVNDVYLRAIDRWASQITSMTRVGVNSVSLVANSNYTWLTLTVSAKYAPVDDTHTAFSAWSLFINGAFVTSVSDSVNVAKFGASGPYWAYESFGIEQKQFNIFIPKGALVQVISGGANLLISADLRVDLTP